MALLQVRLSYRLVFRVCMPTTRGALRVGFRSSVLLHFFKVQLVCPFLRAGL